MVVVVLMVVVGIGFVMEQGGLLMHGPALKQLRPIYSGSRLPLYDHIFLALVVR